MIKRILVGLAGTEYTKVAVRRAVELAHLHEAEITGVTVMDPRHLRVGAIPAGAGASAKELRTYRAELTQERIDAAIADLESICAADKIPFRARRETGDAFQLMRRLARFHDLTVFGLRSVFEYFFEDADSSALLARLLGEGVRPILAVSKEYRPIHRVLFAYSGSMESARTIRWFVQQRPWPDVTMKVVTFGANAEDARERLEEAVAYCGVHGLTAQSEHAAGSPTRGVLEHATAWNADLVVLGNSMRSLLRRRIFGDTALHTIQNADRPLFLSH